MTNNAATTAKLTRSRNDRMIAGVCGGFAKRFGFDPALVRVLLAAATVLGLGSGIVLYVICWMVIPEND
jgi:phage shock protein PspC (stress-responsive transcriptional regulator)